MSNPSLLILAGDGIGPEVMDQVKRIITWFGDKRDMHFDVSEDLVGGAAYDKHGTPLRDETMASHAAAVYDGNAKMLSVAEDVGRHNALDKAIGKTLLADGLQAAAFVVLSSRVSFEMVQKTARARIPIILAVSRPTALAVKLASQLNMTVACRPKKSGLIVYCGGDRIRGK